MTAEEAGKGSGSKAGGGTSKPSGPGKASMPAPSNMAAFRATLWTNLDQVHTFFYKYLMSSGLKSVVCSVVDFFLYEQSPRSLEMPLPCYVHSSLTVYTVLINNPFIRLLS